MIKNEKNSHALISTVISASVFICIVFVCMVVAGLSNNAQAQTPVEPDSVFYAQGQLELTIDFQAEPGSLPIDTYTLYWTINNDPEQVIVVSEGTRFTQEIQYGVHVISADVIDTAGNRSTRADPWTIEILPLQPASSPTLIMNIDCVNAGCVIAVQ